MFKISKEYSFCSAHRIVGHEGKCKHFHGHNYKAVFFFCSEELDNLGRVIDFSEIKKLCGEWIDEKWDHKLLLYDKDPLFDKVIKIGYEGITIVPFNATAENMAHFLLEELGKEVKKNNPNVKLYKVIIEETPTSKAFARL